VRTVYLGTSEFAVEVLRRLAGSEHRPGLVITRPDRPRGRGRKLASPPAAQAARELGIPVEQPDSVNDQAALEAIALADPQAVCVCAFGGLIKEPLLSSYRMLNVHPSLLPRWRGAAPIERAIMAGDDLTGVTIMRVGAGLDSGPVCAQVTEPIRPQDTHGSLAPRLAALGGELLVHTLSEDPPCLEQDEDLVTYAEKITPEDRRLDPAGEARQLERTIRALSPHIGAYVKLPDGQPLGVIEARVIEDAGVTGQTLDTTTPSTGLDTSGSAPILRCRGGALELLAVRPPGRAAMTGEDWLRGLRR
jgi:methionyl-tRNA formyltransferase